MLARNTERTTQRVVPAWLTPPQFVQSGPEWLAIILEAIIPPFALFRVLCVLGSIILTSCLQQHKPADTSCTAAAQFPGSA